MKRLRNWIFWPVFLLLSGTIILNLLAKERFEWGINLANEWILVHFHWLFSVGTLVMFLSCVLIFFLPQAKEKIGGREAIPLLSRWQWFSITLCTTIATGILFWGTAEPIYHLQVPTRSLGIVPGSREAGEFAVSTLFFHWSFVPYAIYSIPVMAFAIAFYNQKQPYSLSSAILLFKGGGRSRRISNGIDTVCLFALVLGMAASLGAGILTISGGLEQVFHFKEQEAVRIFVTALVILAFTASASTGILKGIRFLSVVNVYFFIFLAVFFVLFVANGAFLRLISNSLADFVLQFFQKSLFTLLYPDDPWGSNWTVFNWANWLAWAPVTALFLARISVGYTIRELLIFNWLLPSLFSILWMAVFGGTSVIRHLSGDQDMISLLNQSGPESLIYSLLSGLPFYGIVATGFLVTVFLSFVTAADSNTEAMSSLSTKGFGFEQAFSPVWVKILWGVLIGTTSYLMISLAGIRGIKILSTLGGFPSLILLIVINAGLLNYFVTRK